MTNSQETDYRTSQRGAMLSIAAYILLSGLKIGIGWWSGSKALLADGVNNLTDVIGSVAVFFGLRVANRPPDGDHRYGHQRAESVASVIVASIMGLIGLDVLVSAAGAVFRKDLEVPHPLSIWVGLGSAVVMLIVYGLNIRLARRTNSRALAAAAYDNRSDAITSVGAVLGIVGAHLGWRWLDPVAGVAVAIVIIHTALSIGVEAAQLLMDGFDVERLRQIRNRVSNVKGVVQVHDLKARHLGSAVAVEVTIRVPSEYSLIQAHQISDSVEQSLLGYMSIAHVHVHVEPINRVE